MFYPGNIPVAGWFDLQPERFIHVRAITRPEKATGSFCVFYKQRGVALVTFNESVELQLDAEAEEPQCVAFSELHSLRSAQTSADDIT